MRYYSHCVVCSSKVAAKGFTLLVDNRSGYYKTPKLVVRGIHSTIGARLSNVIIIKREQQLLDTLKIKESFRREKYGIGVEVKTHLDKTLC